MQFIHDFRQQAHQLVQNCSRNFDTATKTFIQNFDWHWIIASQLHKYIASQVYWRGTLMQLLLVFMHLWTFSMVRQLILFVLAIVCSISASKLSSA